MGAAAAAYLAQSGAKVVLIEAHGLASGASGANSGVVQYPFDPVLASLYRRSLSLYRNLDGLEMGFTLPEAPTGMLFVSSHERTVRNYANSITGGFPELRVDVLGGRALQDVEPGLHPDLWGCLVNIGYPIAPGASTYAFASMAESFGASIRQGRAATLDVADDTVKGVLLDRNPIAAGAVLVAAGPATGSVIDPAGEWRPVRPIWGVIVDVQPATTPRHVLEDISTDRVEFATGPQRAVQLKFNVVPHEASVSVGSTFLRREPASPAWIERILINASRFLPALADTPVRGAHACARPQSIDGRPLIGRVAGRGNLFVCAGHGPWGISTGPASAALVVEEILGRSPPIPDELSAKRAGSPDRLTL